MAVTKRCLVSFSFYDQQAIRKKLEEMAARGWMVEKAGSFVWTYRRMQPKKLRFSVSYFPEASDFDPRPTERQMTKEEFCAQDGWMVAVRWGSMQIFYNEREDPVPIETDPVVQVETVSRAMRKNVLIPQAVFLAAGLVFLFLQAGQLWRDPAEYLSDRTSLSLFLLWTGILCSCAYEIAFCLWWQRAAKREAEENGVFLPVKSNRALSMVLIAGALAVLILACFDLAPALLFLCLAGELLAVAGALGVKRRMKRRGVSRAVNRAVVAVSAVLFTIVFLSAATAAVFWAGVPLQKKSGPVGSYEYGGRVWDIYDDPLPVTVEEITGASGQWSKEARLQKTALAALGEYRQTAFGEEAGKAPELEYTVVDIRVPFLYGFIRERMLASHQDIVRDGFLFYDSYFPADASAWGAEEAYRLRWSSGFLNTYLVCWEDRIAEITFYWDPTPEEIGIVAGRLGR